MASEDELLTSSDANMAEILRAWNDEEDEMVEFIQSTRPIDDEDSHRRRAENGGSSYRDIDIHEDGRTTLRQPKERSTLSGRPGYLRYTRCLKASALFMSFFGLGMTYAIYGPAMVDLAYHTSSSISNMASIFSSRAIGFMVGSIVGGWLVDKYDPCLVLGFASLGGALGLIIFPLVDSVAAFAIMALLMSVAFGAVDKGGNTLVFILWPNKSTIYLQYLHFMFGVGAFFAPLLVKPFLLQEAIQSPTFVPSITPNVTVAPTNITNTNSSLDINNQFDAFIASSYAAIVPVTWAYWINAIPFGVSGVIFLIFAFLKTCKEPYIKRQDRLLVASGQNGKVYTVVIATLFFLLLVLYVGVQILYGGLLFTFVVESKTTMTRNDAALLTASYWGSFGFARLTCIPLSKYVKPPRMLLCNVIGSLLGGIILISQFSQGCAEMTNSKLWAGTIILGFSMSSVFPAIMSWAEYFLEVTGRIATILIIGACVGEMLVPVTVGKALEINGPCTLMYCVFTMSVLGLMTFAAIVLFARHFNSFGLFSGVEFRHRGNDAFEEPPAPKQHDDEVLKLLEQNNAEIFSNGNGDET